MTRLSRPASEEPKTAVIQRPEPYKPDEYFENTFFPSKPIPYPPIITPSSIPNPNPNPSVTAIKPETGFPSLGGCLYNIPGYSAFQPVNHLKSAEPPQPTPIQTEPLEFEPFPTIAASDIRDTKDEQEKEKKEVIRVEEINADVPKQQDYEEHIAVLAPKPESETLIESKINITSIAQGSGSTVTIPAKINTDMKKKAEKYSLKTSIPISNIDMKCINTSVDTEFTNDVNKPKLNPTIKKESKERPKVEIKSNIVIKIAHKETDTKEKDSPTLVHSNNISTLLNAAEVINNNDGFRVPEPKTDALKEVKDCPPVTPPAPISRPQYNQPKDIVPSIKQSEKSKHRFSPVNLESNKQNFLDEPPDGGYYDQKNQLMCLQNPNPNIPLTTQQQAPLVLLQRTNLESKNLQTPSRLSSQGKKSKDDAIADASSKVVLKRLHQETCDENDFENLITENQIYGNKIVVKERAQVQQEDWECNIIVDKQSHVVKPNLVYLSTQFTGNIMMIKSSKICQTIDSAKMQISSNENRSNDSNIIINNNNYDLNTIETNNNVLQTLSNNNNHNAEVVFKTNKRVIITSQVIYKPPIVVTEADNKIKNQTVITEPKVTAPMVPKKKWAKLAEEAQKKSLLICQVDTNLKPKIVIANLRPIVNSKAEEVSMLDMYENKKRLRRLKYLTNSSKDQKTDTKKNKAEINVITPGKMKYEIFKELRTKGNVGDSSDSEHDCEEDELNEYNSIIERFGENYNKNAKVDFLAGFSLASKETFREKQLERHERTLRFDSVASAYIAAGQLHTQPEDSPETPKAVKTSSPAVETRWTKKNKHLFLENFKLMQVSPGYKADYEKAWHEILRERNRRNCITNQSSPEPLDPDGQLQMLTEINRSVHENNDLIKKRLDSVCNENSDIRILAEKNFSELNRLSKMADRSVKLLSGQDTKKRDLNPGFDSENSKKFKIEPKHYLKLNIPSITSIISLKSDQTTSTISSTQATSMDEPANSASCGFLEVKTKEVGCQSDEWLNWPGADFFVKSYREYQSARKKEIDELYRSNTRLRVECAHVTRSASTESDRARALLAERQNLAGEEAKLRRSLEALTRAIATVRNS